MESVNTTDVTIRGINISLASSENGEYIQKLADYVNEKFELVQRNSKTSKTPDTLVDIVLAVNLADELFKERTKNETLELKIKKENLKIASFEKEIKELRRELDELKELLE